LTGLDARAGFCTT